ncbi:hypothetical protein [Chitinophaga sancti]|uniref:Uncharacterized protein n=1 Tax=Chitinophaga sancti TaxID=1004 RepID=A0A1K1MIT5_9BACT|nr:hypothetical protein [Chitinophaga sancti]WQD62726.1 hypothetical protein U0033_33050 [Chitinophaga sancti]WQG91650.1 hypothetical protein SR876_09055 [Chitinophaga sancti]SFW23040.1 hypothetical protein SAMN05661012_00614 [Chitinophaga sancti]
MEYNEIRELLSRYWEGETSLEEEELLRSFFAGNRQELPADLREAAALFGYFVMEGEREMAGLEEMEDLEKRVLERGVVGEGALEEISSQEGKEKTKRNTVLVSMPRPYQHWMKYAAVLLLGVGLAYSGRQFKIKQEQMNDRGMAEALNKVDTYDDPKEAYVATKKALELLAKNLNKGTAQAKKIAYFNEATEIIKAD